MLLERATGLTGKIDRYQKLKAAAKAADIVRTRTDQIGKAAALIAHAREAIDRFKAAGVAIQFAPANADDLSEKASVLRTIAAETPAGLADPPFNIAYDFTDRLSGIALRADAAIRDGWRRYIEANSPGGSEEVLDALGKLPQLRLGVTRIRQCRQRIAALAATPPTEPARAIDELRELVAEHRTAWTELTSDNVPDAVIRFLRACAGEGAQVAALTVDVRNWLETRDLLGSLRIRIG
ncbi:hypothetical protein GCT13_25560 [Paraburkholderia sp. CNPSo 3157]|uniref:Uncharacterized protein n=1 Tax=Paraburkholderia franconis TaxID=2654983 RepID=A0A7X1NE20_9BURK|nr:hypothetical protein [Paraburkholderia franconis]MPW20164.1 hypothetical protein [Paraburkholderia franconis]